MTGGGLILTAVGVPLAGALLIGLVGCRPNLREAVTLSISTLLFLTVLSILPQVLADERPQILLLTILPGLEVAFRAEPLGMLFSLVASFLWIINSIYSIGYMRANDASRQTSFYAYFAVALASTIGIAFAANLFTLFLFYEALTFSTYPLVTHNRTEEAVRAGRLYLLLLLGTSFVFFLTAILWTLEIAGTLDFRPGGIIAGKAGPVTVGFLLLLYIFGIGKAAVMPLHKWLPAAMVAPTPVSALLHAVAVVKAGVFTVVKVMIYVFGIDLLADLASGKWLIYVASATVLGASLIALRQDNLKLRLAFSTISQLSYVVLGVAILTPLSTIGAALHIAAHAFGKITLFFAAGSIYTAAHKTKVSQLNGIGRAMPWTMAAFTIGALSMIGVPPTAGFIGKWYMLEGAMVSGQMVAVAVIVVSTLLNVGYYMPIVYAAFFRPMASGAGSGEAPWPIVVALSVTAVGTIVLFFMSDLLIGLARQLVLV